MKKSTKIVSENRRIASVGAVFVAVKVSLSFPVLPVMPRFLKIATLSTKFTQVTIFWHCLCKEKVYGMTPLRMQTT